MHIRASDFKLEKIK